MTRFVPTAKVTIPNTFSMRMRSDYARAAARVFFEDGPAEELDDVEAAIARASDQDAARLCRETVEFRWQGRVVPVEVDVAGNNQLLGACRDIAVFAHGYEPEIHGAIDVLTPPDAVIFDIGANWAPISFQAAMRDEFRGTIFAFEPQSRAFADMSRFVKALSLDDRIVPNRLALSDREGEMALTDSRWRGNVALSPDGRGERCRLARLDDLPLPPPHLIKIDVEGHEAKVVAGGIRTIGQARPYVVFEDWSHHPKDHFTLLAGMGYTFYRLGWDMPFLGQVVEEPPFLTDIQILAFQPFGVDDRDRMPERINVLAAPEPMEI